MPRLCQSLSHSRDALLLLNVIHYAAIVPWLQTRLSVVYTTAPVFPLFNYLFSCVGRPTAQFIHGWFVVYCVNTGTIKFSIIMGNKLLHKLKVNLLSFCVCSFGNIACSACIGGWRVAVEKFVTLLFVVVVVVDDAAVVIVLAFFFFRIQTGHLWSH